MRHPEAATQPHSMTVGEEFVAGIHEIFSNIGALAIAELIRRGSLSPPVDPQQPQQPPARIIVPS